MGSGARSPGLWFHPGLRAGGGTEGEKKCEREQKGVQGGVERGRQGRRVAQEAGLIQWHCGDSGISDFRERMLSRIHVTR